MTIHHLIQKAKSQLIQRHCDHLFVFHCSGLTNFQWRQLKHLLYLMQANTLFGTSHLTLSASRSHASESSALFASQELCTSIGEARKGPICVLYVMQPLNSSKSKKHCFSPFSFPFRSVNSNENKYSLLASSSSTQKTVHWANLLSQIHASETLSNTSLLLLYGQIQLTIMNHVDIQHAAHLQSTPVLRSLVVSIENPILELCFYLNQSLIHFVWYNWMRHTAVI